MSWHLRRIYLLMLMLIACQHIISFVLEPVFPRSRSQHQRRSMASSIQVPEENNDAGNHTHVFLRFSPLIGGPTFLPLHVEVIIAVEDTTTVQTKMDTIYIRRDKSFSAIPIFKDSVALHRFDFLPENPTDPLTLARLFTLQSVPGMVRNRSMFPLGFNDESTEAMDTDRNGMTILIPVGSQLNTNNDNVQGDGTIVSAAMAFKSECSARLFKEIRIIGGKNCLSFALDLLSYLETTTGLKRITSLMTLDLK